MRATGAVMTAAMLLLVGGCQKKEAAHTINDTMAQVMEPSAELIWDLMSKAYNDKGDALDAAKLTEADWAKIAEASAKMQARAQELFDAEHHVVTAEGVPILGSQAVGQPSPPGADWAAVSAKTVQERIDAKPALFKEKAKVLLDAANDLNRAARGKDIVLLYRTGSELDEVCDGCHEPFWGTDVPPPFPK